MRHAVVVTSGPSSVWPKKAYRNPTDQLVKFLDYKHDKNWAIFEFRAEGTGYPDSEVYNRIHHFPWPDHHPPPFALIPNLMASMRNWLHGDEEQEKHTADKEKRRVAVVHCKAGKGRSGTVACSYLISQEGWSRADALKRFTERRMRAGFGEGVSIPSQLRYVTYVDRWTNELQKHYVERPVEILEVHVWGLRDGVRTAVNGFVEDGRQIKCFHTFGREEKVVIDDGVSADPQTLNNAFGIGSISDTEKSNVIFRPASPLILPSSDIDLDFERRNTATNVTGWTMVTSLAHVWFNAYFEGGHKGADSGVFEIDWEAMDGIKGSAKKGIKALEKLKVVWRYVEQDGKALGRVVTEPARGEPVPEPEAADWKGGNDGDKTAEAQARHSDGVTSGRSGGSALTMGATIAVGAESLKKELGLKKDTPESANVSRANSDHGGDEHHYVSSKFHEGDNDLDDGEEGVKTLGPNGEEHLVYSGGKDDSAKEIEGRKDTKAGHNYETGMGKLANVISKIKGDGKHDSTKP